jgi:hypothetical protein
MPQIVLFTVLFAVLFARQAKALRVTFFDQKDFKGDSYTFYGGVTEANSDCTPCVKVVRPQTASVLGCTVPDDRDTSD